MGVIYWNPDAVISEPNLIAPFYIKPPLWVYKSNLKRVFDRNFEKAITFVQTPSGVTLTKFQTYRFGQPQSAPDLNARAVWVDVAKTGSKEEANFKFETLRATIIGCSGPTDPDLSEQIADCYLEVFEIIVEGFLKSGPPSTEIVKDWNGNAGIQFEFNQNYSSEVRVADTSLTGIQKGYFPRLQFSFSVRVALNRLAPINP